MTTRKSSPQGPQARVLEGVQIARDIEAQVQREVEQLKAAGVAPHLLSVQVGQNPATDLYIRNQKRRFMRLGIRFTHLSLDQDTDNDGIISHIHAFNENPTVTGIMLNLPLPGHREAMAVQEQIRPEKDVEGVGPFNLGNLIYNRGQVGPCTALAVLEAVKYTGLDLEGSHAVIVGHSDIVGKPVTLCLLRELATTTTCHIATRDLAEETRRADLLVVAVGKAGLITGDMIKSGAVVIDVGTNEVAGNADADGSKVESTQIVGDVVYEDALGKASWITPVPGGIGRVTVAMLARNTVLCSSKQLD
jgi:methylenetetrahydrofolate dehydrogenase (NADP+)/methenyltetrahydrofolate cyclohydrolase